MIEFGVQTKVTNMVIIDRHGENKKRCLTGRENIKIRQHRYLRAPVLTAASCRRKDYVSGYARYHEYSIIFWMDTITR